MSWLFKSSFAPAVYTLPEATSPWVSETSADDVLKDYDIGWIINCNFSAFI